MTVDLLKKSFLTRREEEEAVSMAVCNRIDEGGCMG